MISSVKRKTEKIRVLGHDYDLFFSSSKVNYDFLFLVKS
jgi:hypothetical protein